MTLHPPTKPSWNGLTETRPTLPSSAYLSDEAFRRDLDAIWYRHWIHVCRSSDLAEPRAFRLTRIGDQEILLLRHEDGGLRAFHNSCRHRGAALKSEECGRLAGRLIVCPYHAWSYSMDGALVRTSSKVLPAGFDKAAHGLYPVAVSEWRGFVFVNLAAGPGAAVDGFDGDPGTLASWPLERLERGPVYRKEIACNWKVFWENFNECLHCPGVHPELSALVPIYGRGLMERRDDPAWQAHADDDAPQFSGRLRDGAETWSRDGSAQGRAFAGLTEADRRAGQSYVTHLPSFFVVGHADYVRSVSLRPLGPSRTELTAEWYFAEETRPETAEALDNVVAFGTLVLDQDAAICEVNQRGLSALPHRHGTLMPEEYEIARFHGWVAARTG
ncbi:aromatic ring-hydroxylating oxygenase subunit alpha [Aquibium microcysteis]|uniref:aromatic ring-hydroxylating oxygenase subunit alpha n=1 Tax=Aquibium microcysteis TaxID=675281 RepID=UPI00165CF3B0|nr:aromatic ring-hydroxylating dioxygenase subunit alpha [Aquibium microcysteis]